MQAKHLRWKEMDMLYIKRNSMLPQANANNPALPDTPPELCGLTALDERLLSLL